MDLSSKYFPLLRRPSASWFKHLYAFLTEIHKVGKSRELISFAIWEIGHRSRFYRLRNKYIQFSDSKCFSLPFENEKVFDEVQLTAFLNQKELNFESIDIDWKYCVEMSDKLVLGCRYSRPNSLYGSIDYSESAVLLHEFPSSISSLFSTLDDILFVCCNGIIYRSEDSAKSFKKVLKLSTPISYFLFNNGMSALPDGTLVIGEYGSLWQGDFWQNLAYVYFSIDKGVTWKSSDFLIKQGVNKHVHLVKYSHQLKLLFLTDGDNKKQFWVKRINELSKSTQGIKNEGWELLNRFHHQTGGYTSMAETGKAVLFGSDYLGGTNFIVRTLDGKEFSKLVLPDPYRRSPIMNMTAVKRSSSETEVWAASYCCISRTSKSLLMRTKDSGKSWDRVLDFEGLQNEVRIVSSSYHTPSTLYISITCFERISGKNRHLSYKLAY